MKIISFEILANYFQKHAETKRPLIAWYNIVLGSNWNMPHDVKHQFKTASFLKNNRVVFNIKGNKYRLVVDIAYKTQIVFIYFFGTHSEYDKMKFE